MKNDGKIQDAVEQKNALGLLAAKLDQSRSAVNVNQLIIFYSSVTLPLASQMVQCEKQKISASYGAIDLLLNHNISLENYTGVNYLFVDVAAVLRPVKNVPKTFENLAIKLINAIPQRCNVVYFVCDTCFERSIKVVERNNRGNSDRLAVRSRKYTFLVTFKNF